MSGWGNDMSNQPQATGQVSFYDPTQFQKNVNQFPATSAANTATSVPNNHSQEGNSHQDVTSAQGADQNTWNSWGGWGENTYGQGDLSQNPAVSNADPTQQWYNQNSWENYPQQQVQGQWNAQQWDNSHFNHQEQGAPNQYAGYEYNQYWNGQNESGVPTSYAGGDMNSHIPASDANYYNQDQSSAFAQMNTGTDLSTSVDHPSGNMQKEDVNSTSTLQSSDSSIKESNQVEENYGESAGMGNFFHSDDYVEENTNNSHQGGQQGDGNRDGDIVPNANNNGMAEVPLDGTSESASSETELSNQMSGVQLEDGMSQNMPNQENVDTNALFHQSSNQQHPYSHNPHVMFQSNQAETVSPFMPQSPENQQVSPEETVPKDPVAGKQGKREGSDGTPAFSDWEMVPPAVNAHSRNASLDNNVKFFISSTNSSTRVSPASQPRHDDPEPSSATEVTGQSTGAPAPPLQDGSFPVQASENSDKPPPSAFAIAPPMMSANKDGANPFRKSPKPGMTASSSNNDVSVLSSTHLDVTRRDELNSPVVLNQSISPIPVSLDRQPGNTGRVQSESPDLQPISQRNSVQDTPLSSNSKKKVPQSPIIVRKESPFQPPKQEVRGKPVKASHDIPGISSKVQNSESRGQQNRDGERERPAGRKTPDWDSSSRREDRRKGEADADRKGTGRRTPDWDSDRRRAGRRTPDWDSDSRRGGRRTPDWDADTRRTGRRTPEWDSRDRGDRYGKDRDRDADRLSSRPPAGPGGNISKAPRTRQSAFHHLQTSRSKNNVSPATSLWDTPDNLPVVSNILLVPATTSSGDTVSQTGSKAPSVLTPVASLITSLSEQIKTDDSDTSTSKSKPELKAVDRNENDSRDRYKGRDTRDGRGGYGRERDSRDDVRGNRSYESLGEREGRGLKDSRNNSRERMSMYGSRSSLDQDDPRDRSRRGDSRERDRSYKDDYYDKYRERPPSRNGSTMDDRYGRRDYRDRDRDYRKTDRYDRDRPKSRYGDRPASRQGDGERPRSRTDYERDQYYRDKYGRGAFDYEDYYRRGGRDYYDRQYYDYYYGNYSQVAGYYDDQSYYQGDTSVPRYQYDPYQRRSRTGTPGSLSDGGEEISSIAEKNKKSDKGSDKKRFDYPPELHEYSRNHGYDDYYGYYDNQYPGYRWDPNVSEWVATTTDVVPARQTPEKFMIPHTRACFGPTGQLVRVLPNRPADGEPATVEVMDLQGVLEEEEENEELREFPGPLVRGDTHKNDVLLFCQRKAKFCADSMELNDRESAELIWKFLELLIKQNGTVVGTDIADLLLLGHEPSTLDYRRTGMKIAQSTDNLEAEDDGSEEHRVSRGTTPIDRSMVNRGKSLEEVTDRFRHLLLYGRKKDALDWAMKNNLWGHALFLASKMDSRAHANVMTKFANVAMRMNDPLQTLYQLMSGRQPAAVTSVTEEKWGDWRPHLAMILSNHSQKPELDRKCITALGDNLASKGFLHASHFCYLMSRTSFGSFNRKSSKIVLIGSSHGLPLETFATNEAIQCTEIYEYALALGSTSVNLSNFQYFKYLYATRLADCGYAQEALHYCEVISRNINSYPALYQQILVKLVYDLSSQLKYSDPQRLEESEEEDTDPTWLKELETTLVQFEEGAIQPVSGSGTPAYFAGTTASSESGEIGMYMQGADHTSASYIAQEGTFAVASGIYSTDPALQYPQQIAGNGQNQYQQQVPQYDQGDGSHTGQVMSGADNQYHQPDVPEGNFYQPNNTQYQQQGVNNYGHQQWGEQHKVSSGFESTNQNQPQPESANQQPANQQESQQQPAQDYYQHQQYGHNTGSWSHGQPQGFPNDVNLSESQTTVTSRQTDKRSSLASTSSFSQDNGEEEEGEDRVDSTGFAPQPSIFDIQPAQQKIIAPRLRQRTISETSNGSTVDNHHAGRSHQQSQQQQQQQQSKNTDNKDGQAKGKSGGGIWGKLGGLFTRKNEMKLPDDKEPSIVWDPVKKRWIDKDADENDDVQAGPPPKDVDLSGSSSRASAAPAFGGPAPASGPAPSTDTSAPSDPPPPGGNKFSRRRTLGARNQYVDVLNPKPAGSAPVPSNLFNTLPSSHSAPAIFNPGGLPDAPANEAGSQPQKHDTIPEEKNSGAGHSDVPPQNAQLQLPPTDNSQATSAPGPTPSMPAMFNPSQFQNQQAFKQPGHGPGNRLSNRRVYPK